MTVWAVTMDPTSNLVAILKPAPPINLPVWIDRSAFPKHWSAMATVVVLIIHTHLLHNVMIVLMNTFSSVRDMAKRFAMQISTNAMASSIAMIEQTKLLHIVIIVPVMTFSNVEKTTKSFVVQSNTNAMALHIATVT